MEGIMRRNILREKLNNNESTISTHIHSVWPSVVEAIGPVSYTHLTLPTKA